MVAATQGDAVMAPNDSDQHQHLEAPEAQAAEEVVPQDAGGNPREEPSGGNADDSATPHQGDGEKSTLAEAVKKRRAEKKAKKAKQQQEKAKARVEQARVVADRENRPEPELIAEMQGACAKRLEAWRSSRKWKPGEAALLDEALEAIAKSHSPTLKDTEARQAVMGRVTRAIRQSFPAQQDIRVEAFGSYVSGFYNSTSDLDMSLEGSWVKDNSMPDLKPIDQMGNWGKNTRAKMLKKLCSILKKAKVSRGYVQIIAHARVPLIKFVDLVTGISCDLCIGNAGAAFKSHVLGYLTGVDRRFVPMTMLVKRWAKEHSINNPTMGTFNSFALTLMVIFFLQNIKPAVLPPICDLFDGSGDDFRGRPLAEGPYTQAAGPERLEAAQRCAAELRASGFGSKQTAGVAELFAEFIALLSAAMDWWTKEGAGVIRISAWAGMWTCRPWSQSYIVAVEDPFDSSENCARTLSSKDATESKVVQHVVAVASWTREALKNVGPGTSVEALLGVVFGGAAVRALPPDLHRRLREQRQQKQGGGSPATPILKPPRLPASQQERGGLQAGDIMFRSRDEWRNGTPASAKQQRAGNRQTLPEVPKSPEDRYAELAGQDVELPRSTTPSPGGSPDGKTRGVAPYGKITLPLPPGATRGQAAAAAPAAAPAVPPPPPPSHRPRKSPPLRNPSPSPPGFGQPDSPPPPGFAPAAAPVSANKPQAASGTLRTPSGGRRGGVSARGGRSSRGSAPQQQQPSPSSSLPPAPAPPHLPPPSAAYSSSQQQPSKPNGSSRQRRQQRRQQQQQQPAEAEGEGEAAAAAGGHHQHPRSGKERRRSRGGNESAAGVTSAPSPAAPPA